ncbi:unnamed protein product, partial [Meganyctiphanes norvegica]
MLKMFSTNLMKFFLLSNSYKSSICTPKITVPQKQRNIRSFVHAGFGVCTRVAIVLSYLSKGPKCAFIPFKKATEGDHASGSEHDHEHSGENHGHMEGHNLIGISLLLGFLLMMLIDQCAGGHHKPDPENGGASKGRRASLTATLGLVVHAAADGIALGAAAASSHTDVEMIVFFAIMLHKAPAAFGLVSFLLHEGLDRVKIRRHLLTFALAAPIGAFVTYFGITQSGSESLSSSQNTGAAMLFSAGTFLYVSTVHVLPELTSHSHDGTSSGGPGQFSRKQLLALICGSLLPLLLSVGHHH